MTAEEARDKARELNTNGKHRENWFYYPTCHDNNEWFVMRRYKEAVGVTAIFTNGRLSRLEE